MQGWQSWVDVTEQSYGWGTFTRTKKRMAQDLDSEALTRGIEVKELDSKIVWGRFGRDTTVRKGQMSPGGNFTTQPRTDDVLPLLMSFFQCVDQDGTTNATTGSSIATFYFAPISTGSVKWVGSTWGTFNHGSNWIGTANSVYPIMVRQVFSGIAGNNVVEYKNGIVDSMTWNFTTGEIVNAEFVFKFGTSMIGTTSDQPSNGTVYYSAYDSWNDWEAHVTFKYKGVATTLEVSSLTFTGNNATEDRMKLGYRGRSNFPFTGRPVIEGEIAFLAENLDYLTILENCGSAFLSVNVIGTAGTNPSIYFEMPNIKFRPFDLNPASATEPISYTIPFRALPTADDGTGPILAKVYTNLATKVVSFVP